MPDNIFGTTSTPSLISVAEAASKVMTEATVLSITDVDKWTTEIYKGIDAGWKSVGKSTLGGDENVAILIKVTVEPEKDWPNKILQNARFGMIRIATDGTMEMFASDRRVKNMRKTKIKSAKDVVNKINTWIKTVSEEVEIDEAASPPQMKSTEQLKFYNKLKTGDTFKVWYQSTAAKGDVWREFKVTGKTPEKMTLQSLDHPNKKTAKFYLYNRGKFVSWGMNDKTINVTSMREEVEIKEARALSPLSGKPFEDLRSVADAALKVMTGQPQEVKEEEKETVESEEKPQELTEEIV